MAGGSFVSNSDSGKVYAGRTTFYVVMASIVAATGGLIFGYDIGISGGVTSMDTFLEKFFPEVYRKEKADTSTNQYCKFNSLPLTMFTSSLYLAGLVASIFASSVTRIFGRKISMLFGGFTFLVGAAINGAASSVGMLIAGRILLGIGVGFANQSVPVYLSEMAPANRRGTLNIVFQFMITIGILAANLVNYGTAKISGGWGWRVSLALAGVPALMITVGSLCLPDTPNYLIERGHEEEARSVLRKIRGTEDIQLEFQDMVAASEESRKVKHPWSNILKRHNRPPLTMAVMIPFFQQLTGINVVMFYAPVLFKTIGFGNDASLMSAVITGGLNVVATVLSICYADRWGRRKLFLAGGIQMFFGQIVVGSLIAYKFGVTGSNVEISKGFAGLIVGFIVVYVMAFAWSWGPMGWLVPSEIFPLEIRSAGQSINVVVNMFWTFVIAQIFLFLLCHLKFGLFYFFSGWVAIMTLFIYFLLPETKNVPIEEMVHVWKSHWFWRRFVSEVSNGDEKKAPENV